MRSARIRVIVVEDDSRLLECLKMEIDRSPSLRWAGGFLKFENAAVEIPHKEPDVVLLDLGLPGMDGIQAIGMIKEKWPRLKIVVFTGSNDAQSIYGAFMAGANGFLIKSTPRVELVEGIEMAYRGGAPMSPAVNEALVSFFSARRLLAPHLSPTEKAILQEYDRGTPQKQIAAKFGMSEHTLYTHRNRILEKTGVSSLLRAAWLLRQAEKT